MGERSPQKYTKMTQGEGKRSSSCAAVLRAGGSVSSRKHRISHTSLAWVHLIRAEVGSVFSCTPSETHAHHGQWDWGAPSAGPEPAWSEVPISPARRGQSPLPPSAKHAPRALQSPSTRPGAFSQPPPSVRQGSPLCTPPETTELRLWPGQGWIGIMLL